MIRIFKTTDSGIRKVAVAEEGCWIALTNPTSEELTTIADQFNIDVDDLKAPWMKRNVPVYRWRRIIH